MVNGSVSPKIVDIYKMYYEKDLTFIEFCFSQEKCKMTLYGASPLKYFVNEGYDDMNTDMNSTSRCSPFNDY
jgi:hypothetical protein